MCGLELARLCMAKCAIVWYNLGNSGRADLAMSHLEKIQNRSGGFYGRSAKYISVGEISWAVKYFLDAYLLKLRGE